MHKTNKTPTSPFLSGSNKLLDLAIAILGLKNDAALSRALGVSPIIISKLRHGKSYIGPSMLIRLHEQTGLSIREMKGYLSLPAETVTDTPTSANDVNTMRPAHTVESVVSAIES